MPRACATRTIGSLEVDDQVELHQLLDWQVARFFALKNPANVDANQAIPICNADIIAHQATGHGSLAPRETGGQRVAGGQCEDLFVSAEEERVGSDYERTSTQLNHRCKDAIEVALGAGMQEIELQSKLASRCLKVSRLDLGTGIGRIDERCHDGCHGHHLVQHFYLLLHQLRGQVAHARDIATWSVEARDKSNRDRVGRSRENDRNPRGRRSCCECRRSACCGNRRHLMLHQLGRQERQSIVLTLSPAVFDRHVPTFDETRFAQALTECARHEAVCAIRRFVVKPSDYWHRRGLLRLRGERPRSYPAADKGNEIAPSHRPLPSSGASIVSANEYFDRGANRVNELVLDFALPASLFVGTVSTPRDQLLQQGPLVLALLIGIVGLYVIVLLLGRQLFRHAMGVAALQAITVCFSAGPYFGPAVLTPVYGASSAVAISMIAIILNIVIVPMTLVLIEISRGTESSAAKSSIASLVGPALVNAVKAPFVWAPLLAVALVFLGVSVPPLVDSALSLIGQATGGVALFVAGLMIAAHKVIFNLEVGANTVLKMLVQPAVFFCWRWHSVSSRRSCTRACF